MKKNKIFIACDSPNTSKIKEIIKKSKTSKLKKLGFLEIQRLPKKYILMKRKKLASKWQKICLKN